MSDIDPAKKAQHRLRLRELSKYYCVTTPVAQTNSQENTNSPDRGYFGTAVDFHPQPPCLANDGILTALAQLAARKLKCRRSLISIVDDQTQYIIAEATPSISFFDKNQHNPDEGLLLGVQPIPLPYGLCPIGLTSFSRNGHVVLDNPENEADTDHIVISDLLSESRTKVIPLVDQYSSHLRYFVEVPLRSDSGYYLGSICAIDPTPRSVGPDDVRNLQDIAKLVIQHLDWARIKEDHGRAERLIEGLSHFIQGKDSISDWSKATAGQANIPNVYNESVSLSQLPSTSSRYNTTSAITNTLAQAPPTPAASISTRDRKPLSRSISATSMDEDTPPPSVPADAAQRLLNSAELDVYTGYDPPAETLPEGDFQQGISASVKIRHAFSKASNLIRESMDLDATCILEVPHNERFKNAGRRRRSSKSNRHATDTTIRSTESGTSSDYSSDASLLKNDSWLDENAPDDDVMCNRLGFSTRTKSSLAGSNTAATYLTLPTKLLARLASKHPEGRIFCFDSFGNLSSDDAPENESPSVSRQTKRTMSHQLHHLFPDARSLVFLPLYDNDKQQLYAAFVGWTNDVARALQSAELNYVSGFTNSVMCEVMRLDAIALDKAKSNFISSISHELRSPLHGILAANQLLSESKMYPQQAEFTHMIDTCAKTLLDIMDHLLDHAKINHFVDCQPHGRRRKGTNRSKDQAKTFSLVTGVDLLSVIEETAVSMAASSNQLLAQGRKPELGTTSQGDASSATGNRDDLSPPIIINFGWHKRWIFETEAGSWRRIIMNLLGNSIKYTRSGYISINLDFKEISSTSTTTRIVELRVTDTGQGISEEYLKHRLYIPFAQENNLSVGTGLGLSLVHQIVSSLKGNIQVFSEVGSGTEVIVQIPLKVSGHEPNDSQLDNTTDTKTLALSTGMSFKTCGFENQPPISEPPTGVLNPYTKALMLMNQSVSSMLIEQFGMEETSGDGANILVIEEKFLGANLDMYDSSSKDLFIIGMEGRGEVRHKLRLANYVYVLPPIGPKRLSHSLKTLLQIRKERMDAPVFDSLDTSTEGFGSLRLLDLGTPPKPPSSDESGVTEIPSSIDCEPPIITTPPHPPVSLEENSEVRDSAASSERKKEAILLVDDNDINLRILIATVTRIKGQTVEYITATNGQEALDRYIETVSTGTRISIVFMDVSMPVMDGFKSTREIRAYERSKGIKKELRATIVALTGLGSLEAQHEIDNCGFDVYLRKPANLKKIREILPDETVEVQHDT